MFENLGTALIQAIGFLGVFAFFIYQLLTEKEKPINSKIDTTDTPKNLFRKKNISVVKTEKKKKGWFSR